MSITKKPFGTTSKGHGATLFSIANNQGMILEVTDFGATWTGLKVPSASGLLDVIPGFDTVSGYENRPGHIGCVVGRNANRISGAKFTLDGVTYPLALTRDNPPLNSHSGPDFYDQRMWEAEALPQENAVRFSLFSPHMDQGFPGNLWLQVTYQLTEDNTVKLIYDAHSDAKTVLNVTNHVYFNLNGHDSGDVWNHLLWIDSPRMTETLCGLPTGRFLEVSGTDYDYTTAKPVRIPLDDNFCEEPHHTLTNPRIRCVGDRTGITLTAHTDLPGFQVYTANGLNAPGGKNGAHYGRGSGICFESQHYVDAINIDAPGFKKPILDANVPFHSETWYQFN